MALKRMHDEEYYLDLKETAKRMSVSSRALRSWMKDSVNPVPGYKIGGRLRFRWQEVISWIEHQRVRPADPATIADEIIRDGTRKTEHEEET